MAARAMWSFALWWRCLGFPQPGSRSFEALWASSVNTCGLLGCCCQWLALLHFEWRREREKPWRRRERENEEDGEVVAIHWAVFEVFKITLFTATSLNFYFDSQMSNFFLHFSTFKNSIFDSNLSKIFKLSSRSKWPF